MITYTKVKEFASLLYVSRNRCSLKIGDAARALKISVTQLGKWERQEALPPLDKVDLVAKTYKIDRQILLERWKAAKDEQQDNKNVKRSLFSKSKKIDPLQVFQGFIGPKKENKFLNRPWDKFD